MTRNCQWFRSSVIFFRKQNILPISENEKCIILSSLKMINQIRTWNWNIVYTEWKSRKWFFIFHRAEVQTTMSARCDAFFPISYIAAVAIDLPYVCASNAVWFSMWLQIKQIWKKANIHNQMRIVAMRSISCAFRFLFQFQWTVHVFSILESIEWNFTLSQLFTQQLQTLIYFAYLTLHFTCLLNKIFIF